MFVVNADVQLTFPCGHVVLFGCSCGCGCQLSKTDAAGSCPLFHTARSTGIREI